MVQWTAKIDKQASESVLILRIETRMLLPLNGLQQDIMMKNWPI